MAGKTLAQRAYEHIHDSIVSGRMAPGSVVSEVSIARDLGVSRTPVGEAIRQLADAGLVEQVPRYGTIVRTIDRRELVELYDVREALESYSAARAAERISPEQLKQLDRYCHALKDMGDEAAKRGLDALDDELLKKFLAADMAFHLLIIQAAGNSRIMKVVRDTRTISRIFHTRRERHDIAVVNGAYAYHSRIIEALRAGNAEGARVATAEHIARSKERALEQFDTDARGPGHSAGLALDLPPDLEQVLEAL